MKTFTYDGKVRIEKEVYSSEFSIPSFLEIEHDEPQECYVDGDQMKFHYDLTRADIKKLTHGMGFKEIRKMLMRNTAKSDQGERDRYIRPVTMPLHHSAFPIIEMFDPEFVDEARGDVWVRFMCMSHIQYVKDENGENVMEPAWNRYRDEWQQQPKTFRTYKISAVLEVESDYLDVLDEEYEVDVCEA